jgi:hypothetical protein
VDCGFKKFPEKYQSEIKNPKSEIGKSSALRNLGVSDQGRAFDSLFSYASACSYHNSPDILKLF